MTFIKFMTGLALAGSLSACGTVDTATRNAPLEVPALGGTQSTVLRNYDVQAVNFTARPGLQVSEANGYYPFADVVWRGDPYGDRIAQIGAIFQAAADGGAVTLDGVIPVIVDVELVRFHGVTERTRYSVGGNYHIVFNLTVRNVVTGELVEPVRQIETNLAAPGGQAAIIADQQGRTEKVRVTGFLTQVLRDELSGPVTL